MSTIEIGFEWTRGGHYECGPAPTDKTVQVIRQRDKRRETYRPLETELSNLHLRFAELGSSPDAYVNFASAWGLLKTPAAEGAMETVDNWGREVGKMEGLISVLAPKNPQPGGILRSGPGIRFRATQIDVAVLSVEAGSRPTMILEPPTLLSAIYLQLANAVAGGNSIRVCAECSRWFHTGIGQKVRRRVAIFCSEECKNRHHYKHRKAKQ
jgi:hypothetical protein